MDGCVYPYRHVEPAATHPFTRQALGLAPDAIVIGAFVTPMKLSRRCLVLWRDVLARVPRARLAFSPAHPALRPVFERFCTTAGIARERLLFVPQGRDDAENQARYALVDFVLDPMPFGGVNGTLEPLDVGVPVVTLVGERHGERSAYSILANLGVTTTVGETGREYVDIAVRLAEDAAFMQPTCARRSVPGIAHSGSPMRWRTRAPSKRRTSRHCPVRLRRRCARLKVPDPRLAGIESQLRAWRRARRARRRRCADREPCARGRRPLRGADAALADPRGARQPAGGDRRRRGGAGAESPGRARLQRARHPVRRRARGGPRDRRVPARDRARCGLRTRVEQPRQRTARERPPGRGGERLRARDDGRPALPARVGEPRRRAP